MLVMNELYGYTSYATVSLLEYRGCIVEVIMDSGYIP